jgi:hypothetical protein
MAKGNDDEIIDHSRRGMFFQRALKSPSVFYGAYAALRFDRKAPSSFTRPKRQAQAYLEEDYAWSVSFRPLARTFLAAHAEDFATSLFWLVHLRFETMEQGGE